MDETQYLTLQEVVDLHDALLERMLSPFAPLVHPDKLESAINRPRNAAYYEGADLIRQAGLLAVGISQSQAFLDGNKRAAFAAADVFLRINRLAFSGDAMEIALQLERVAEVTDRALREPAIDEFEAWLRDGRVSVSPEELEGTGT